MRIRTGTVIWAAVLLVLAAVAFCAAVFDLREYQAAAAAWIVTGLGGVFVIAAVVALIVRSVLTSRRTVNTESSEDQPIG